MSIAAPAIGANTPHEVVAGHTSYVTLTRDAPATEAYNIHGDVGCHVEVNGVRVAAPPQVPEVVLNCMADTVVFTTDADAPDPRGHDLAPTGWATAVTGPNGYAWRVVEAVYTVTDPATGEAETHHAWLTGAAGPYTHPETGDRYAFVTAVNPDHVGAGDAVTVRAGAGPAWL